MPKTVVLRPKAPIGVLIPVFIVLTLFMTACNVVSDRQLGGIFKTNRSDFSRLETLIEADKAVAFLPLVDRDVDREAMKIPMPVERWREYQQLFEKLGIRCGLARRPSVPNAMFFSAECQGSAISRDCKGYVYDEAAPTPIEGDLDSPAPGLHFKPLGGNWYLFRDGA